LRSRPVLALIASVKDANARADQVRRGGAVSNIHDPPSAQGLPPTY
jgi:hypothetical protein